MNELERAKYLLHESANNTLALVHGEETLVSSDRGVKPLLQLLNEKKDIKDWSAADRVVGKAAAFLYVLLGVKEVYVDVISELAQEVLLRHGIAVDGKTIVPRIMNRAGDGACPMESAVDGIEDAEEALVAIKAKIAAMRK